MTESTGTHLLFSAVLPHGMSQQGCMWSPRGACQLWLPSPLPRRSLTPSLSSPFPSPVRAGQGGQNPSPPRCWQELEDLEAGVVWLARSLIRKGSRDAFCLGRLACLHGPALIPCPKSRDQSRDSIRLCKGPVQPSIGKTQADQEYPDSGTELAGTGCGQVLPWPCLPG